MRTVIEMAREVLLLGEQENPRDDGIAQFIGTLTDFSELVRADEREACAKVCDDMMRQYWNTADDDGPDPADCAAAIRARRTNEDRN